MAGRVDHQAIVFGYMIDFVKGLGLQIYGSKNKCFLNPGQSALGLAYPVLPVCGLLGYRKLERPSSPDLRWENRLGNDCPIIEVRQDLWVIARSSNVSGLT